MEKIQLSNCDLFALVDDADVPLVSEYTWHRKPSSTTVYAATNIIGSNGKRTTLSMHRLILQAKSGQEVDHKDHDGLNNQRENLRLVSRAQNVHNTRPFRGRKFKGVYRHYSGRWYACLKNKCLGVFDDEVSAAIAYNEAAATILGETAYMNPIPV